MPAGLSEADYSGRREKVVWELLNLWFEFVGQSPKGEKNTENEL